MPPKGYMRYSDGSYWNNGVYHPAPISDINENIVLGGDMMPNEADLDELLGKCSKE